MLRVIYTEGTLAVYTQDGRPEAIYPRWGIHFDPFLGIHQSLERRLTAVEISVHHLEGLAGMMVDLLQPEIDW